MPEPGSEPPTESRPKWHHPLCDDDGWDHPGECVVETEFPADPDDEAWERVVTAMGDL